VYSALELRYFDVVGWDVTVDSDSRVICIEYNIKYPGTIIYQFAHGPFAGEKTNEFLSFLTSEENTRFIPKCIQLKK
jgi:hypothetical protein